MLWKCRLGNDGQFGSASSVKSIVSELFPRGSIGNRSALVQLVAWNRPDAKPFPKPMMTWLMQICQRCVKILSSKTYYIDTCAPATPLPPPPHMCTGHPHPHPHPPRLHMCTSQLGGHATDTPSAALGECGTEFQSNLARLANVCWCPQ